MRIHSISLKGPRRSNEDVIDFKQSRKNGEVMAGVFDGHGGKFVAEYVAGSIFNALKNKHSKKDICDAVVHLNQRMIKTHPSETAECGSTLLICRLEGNKLQVIHLGDTRAVLRQGRGVLQLTEDHKPESVAERLRIAKTGEKIQWDRGDRVYRVNGYSVSRAMGDHSAKGISQQCEVRTVALNRCSRYLIMACDGVWDVLSSQDACEFVDQFCNNRDGGNDLTFESGRSKTNAAYALGRHALQKGSGDNISIIILFFT